MILMPVALSFHALLETKALASSSSGYWPL